MVSLIKDPEDNDTHHLTKEQKKIADAILDVMKVHDLTDTGGCRTFYTPQEWRDRGEQYGLRSELIVCHDGGDIQVAFNYDCMCYDVIEEVRVALDKIGYWAEPCTSWYTAIYKN